jgi:hypothetical protein
MIRRFTAALVVGCALLLAGCQTRFDNPAAWGQIASGVGAIIGRTEIDPQIEKVSTRLAKYCTELQTAALAVDAFAPDKLQAAAHDGRIAIASFCAAPPKNLAEAIAGVAGAYAAIAAARAEG